MYCLLKNKLSHLKGDVPLQRDVRNELRVCLQARSPLSGTLVMFYNDWPVSGITTFLHLSGKMLGASGSEVKRIVITFTLDAAVFYRSLPEADGGHPGSAAAALFLI